MFLCSLLTGAELLLYASWWGLGPRASHSGRVYHGRTLCKRSGCLSSLGRVASESETGEMAESKVFRLTSKVNQSLFFALNGEFGQRFNSKNHHFLWAGLI